MKIAWFDCHSGISGDMTLGALLDAGVPIDVIRTAVQSVLPTIVIDSQSAVRHGFRATQAIVEERSEKREAEKEARSEKREARNAERLSDVEECKTFTESCCSKTLASGHHDHDHHHDHEHEHGHDHAEASLASRFSPLASGHHHAHHHRTMADICTMVLNANGLTSKVKTEVIGVFELIAQAEAKAHGCAVEEVHFHEVGAADSIADIVGAVAGLNWLGIEKLYASTVPTGCGTIQIAHGEVSVPAPATAELLSGVPLLPSDVPFELTTPTGAGILKYYVKDFGAMPPMTIDKIGVGAGGRDLSQQANVLRLVIGQSADVTSQAQADSVWQLETNLDDMPGELIGHAVEELWKLTPLDVWTTAVSMKKQRTGVVISVLCQQEQIPAVESALFTHTTTLGIRRWKVERTILKRESCQIQLENGQTIAGKRATLPDGSQRIVPEYEDVCRVAKELGVAPLKVWGELR